LGECGAAGYSHSAPALGFKVGGSLGFARGIFMARDFLPNQFPSIGLGGVQMDSGFRKLEDREREILEALLEAEFPGREEWRAQIILLHADKNGFLSMLDTLKIDGTPIINPPNARDMVVL
jgi:hypothetical protein